VKLQKPCILVSLLTPGLQAKGDVIPQQYDYSYQLYEEENDRIKIESHYVRGKLDITDSTQFRFQWLSDAISGASPTGAKPGGAQPSSANLEDLRTGILGALSQKAGDHRIEMEVSYSEEDDYISKGVAISDEIELNQKNTTLAFGVNYLDDEIQIIQLGDKRKDSYDIFTGVTQVIDKNTVISADLTLGFSDGYLNDQYKVVQRDEILTLPDIEVDVGGGDVLVIPGEQVPVVNIYRENRPDFRFRQVLQLGGKHYFEAEKATIKADLRLSNDDYGIFSQTAQVEWRQQLGEKLQLVPFFRYYHQNAADFFVNDLNNVDVVTPANDPDGSGPHYSSDYRLSSLEAQSVGMRMRYEFSDHFTTTAAYERYVMKGVGGGDTSPSDAYPSANIFTVGVSLTF
jgi:hypothetical protein